MPGKFTLFCGIDIGKAAHMACLLDADGACPIRALRFTNDAAGFALLLQRLDAARQGQPLLIGMEATGHYWYALHEHLSQRGHELVALNPLQTAQQARKQIRKSKTDKIDARHIAVLMKSGDFRRSVIPGELATTCRQLSRLWHSLGCQRRRVKQLLHATVDWLWPEFESHFSDPLGATAHAVLERWPSPQDLAATDLATLTAVVEKISKRKLGEDLARRLLESASRSVGMRRGREGATVCIRTLLQQLDAGQAVRKDLKKQIETLSARLPPCVHTLPGISEVSAVGLFGETDPISTFSGSDQLVAFAGLDLVVFQTGQYEAPRRHVSKRGSPHLRRTLWLMASAAILRPGHLRDYYQRRRREGLHHLSAVTAVAIKICRISWRILTDQRDYRPDAPVGSK